ncbi:MAG: cbb3-type cytochrome c oxidase subunit 3 [Ignavibacteriae bacterium]|nr:cbb3-type cytochrome c oxidase subunit 3 [Ignavibacteriota bacterium]
MKFSNYLGSIENVSIYPIITIILFILVFVGAVLWIVTRDKEYISEMESVPLDNKNDFLNNSENKNESN